MENLSPQILRGVMKEMTELVKGPPEGIKVHMNDEDVTDIQATITGPGNGECVVCCNFFLLFLLLLRLCRFLLFLLYLPLSPLLSFPLLSFPYSSLSPLLSFSPPPLLSPPHEGSFNEM